LKLGVEHFVTGDQSLLLLGAARVLLGDLAGGAGHVFLEGNELAAPPFSHPLVLFELSAQSVDDLLEVLVLVRGLDEVVSLALSQVDGARGLGSPVAGFLRLVAEVHLERGELVLQIAVRLLTVGLGRFQESEAHGALAPGLLDRFDLLLPVLERFAEARLFFRRDPEEALDLRESVLGGTTPLYLSLGGVLLMLQLLFQIYHALVVGASVHDLYLDLGLS